MKNGIKFVCTRARYFFGGYGQGNQWKTEPFRKALRTRKFQWKIFSWQVPSESLGTQDVNGQFGTTNFWPCFGHPKLGDCDKIRSVSKIMRCCKKVYLPQFSNLSFQTQITSCHSIWQEVIYVCKFNFENIERYIFFKHRKYASLFFGK